MKFLIIFLIIASCKSNNNKVNDNSFTTTQLNSEINKFKNISTKELELQNNLIVSLETKSKNLQLTIYAFVLILILALVYISKLLVTTKRAKINALKTEKLNNELKNSITKTQQININLENKNHEIKTLLNLNERTLFSKILKISTYNDIISKICHDLSRLIDSNEEIKANNLFIIENTLTSMIDEDEIWNDFQIQFEKTQPNFFNKLKQISSDLSINDLKHCSYIIAKLRTKDVANLVNLSPRSVETTRYRIKKKLGIGKDLSLSDFLQNLEAVN